MPSPRASSPSPSREIALVDLSGVQKRVSLELVDDVAPGDYVIVHVGYALTKLDPDEAEQTLRTFAEAGIDVNAPLS